MGNAVAQFVPDYDEIRHCTDTKWLAKELTKQLEMTAQSIARLAVLIVRAEELGMKPPVDGLSHYRKIGRGEMSPLVYEAVGYKTQIASKVASVKSIKVQEQLANGKPVSVLERGKDGGTSIVRKTIDKLTLREATQVFQGGGIVPASKQTLPKAEGRRQSSWYLDTAKGELVVIRPCRIPIRAIRHLLVKKATA